MRDTVRKLSWFIGIWALSIATLALVATIIRAAIA
jgi:Protein of unknown function (DUF2474)